MSCASRRARASAYLTSPRRRARPSFFLASILCLSGKPLLLCLPICVKNVPNNRLRSLLRCGECCHPGKSRRERGDGVGCSSSKSTTHCRRILSPIPTWNGPRTKGDPEMALLDLKIFLIARDTRKLRLASRQKVLRGRKKTLHLSLLLILCTLSLLLDRSGRRVGWSVVSL